VRSVHGGVAEVLNSAVTIFQLLLVAFLPGAAIFRLPIASRERRAALDAEERLFWAVVISIAVSLSFVLGLAAAGRYSFQRLLIANGAITVLAVLGVRLRLTYGGAARHMTVTAAVPLLLVILGLYRFFPPSEYIIGGKDPGTYINEGIQIAQRGTLVYWDPVVASVPPFARDLFFPSHEQDTYYSTRFMGFFIHDPDSGAVVGQFPHLLPASIAIGYGLDGLTGARRTTGVWAILGLLAVYFTGARLIGRTAAAAAAGLLALHVIEVWFARYPNAEVVMQALLFAAILASARAHVDGDRFFGPVAAALLGLLLFLRFDTVLGIAAVAGSLAALMLRGVRPRVSFVLILGAIAVVAWFYMLGPLRAYAYLPIVWVGKLSIWQHVALLAVPVAAAAAVWLASRSPKLAARLVVFLPLTCIALVWIAAAYALYLRQPGGKLTDYDAYALRTFTSFYFTLPALLAALLGYALAARRAFWNDPGFFFTVTLFTLFFFYKIRIWPDHFWMTRRFLPVILPGMLLLASAAALSGVRAGPRSVRLLRAFIGLVFVGLLAAHYARASRPLLSHVEYAGVIAKLEHLASVIQDRDLLIVESRETDTHILALPLAYVYARNVLLLASARPDKPTFAAFLDWAKTRYDRVLFMGGGGTDLLSSRWGVRAVATERFQVPEYDAPRNAYPRFVRHKEFDYSIYEFTPPDPVDDEAQFDLDVGNRDDLYVLRFHAKEVTDGRTYRWTQKASFISVMPFRPMTREVTLWMHNGGRSAGAPPPDVSVFLDNERLGTIRVAASGFQPYSLSIPPELAVRAGANGEPVQLRLLTPVWNPARLLGTSDNRELGVMVDRVTVK
jgi:hypothetical protein